MILVWEVFLVVQIEDDVIILLNLRDMVKFNVFCLEERWLYIYCVQNLIKCCLELIFFDVNMGIKKRRDLKKWKDFVEVDNWMYGDYLE